MTEDKLLKAALDKFAEGELTADQLVQIRDAIEKSEWQQAAQEMRRENPSKAD